MAKAKPGASLGDVGPETPAAMAGAEVRTHQDEGKAPVRRKFRDHLLENMARPRKYKDEMKPPLISGRQKDAGIRLFEAWCNTIRSPAQSYIYVQSTPDWGEVALGSVKRIWELQDVSKFIPDECRDVVLCVCVQQIPVYHGATAQQGRDRLDMLKAGLDAIADGLGI